MSIWHRSESIPESVSIALPPHAFSETVVVPVARVGLPDDVLAWLADQRAAAPERLSDTHLAYEPEGSHVQHRCATIAEAVDAGAAKERNVRWCPLCGTEDDYDGTCLWPAGRKARLRSRERTACRRLPAPRPRHQ